MTPRMTIPVDFQSSCPVWKNFSLLLSYDISFLTASSKKGTDVEVTCEKLYKLFVALCFLLDEILEFLGGGGEVPILSTIRVVRILDSLV